MAVTQTADGRWVVYYRVSDGGRSRIKKEYFGRGAAARLAAVDRDAGLGLKKRRPRRGDNGPTVWELAQSYAQARDFSGHNLEVWVSVMRRHLMPAFGNAYAVRVTENDLERYVAKRRREGVKPITVDRELSALKAIFTWSFTRRPKLIPFNPIAGFKKLKFDQAEIIPPSPEEMAAIMAAAAPHVCRAMKLSYYLGLRPGAAELYSLTWSRVRWAAMVIRVVSAKKGGPQMREVPIHPGLADDLRRWRDEDGGAGPIVHYKGKHVKSIKTAWMAALRRAGIQRRIRPYDIRHCFVTTCLEAGATPKDVSEIVGSRPETLMRYYQHVSTERRRKTISLVPSLD